MKVIRMSLLQESLTALLGMRRNSKERELEAMLAGEHDSCSCYIEVNFAHPPSASLFCHFVVAVFKLIHC